MLRLCVYSTYFVFDTPSVQRRAMDHGCRKNARLIYMRRFGGFEQPLIEASEPQLRETPKKQHHPSYCLLLPMGTPTLGRRREATLALAAASRTYYTVWTFVITLPLPVGGIGLVTLRARRDAEQTSTCAGRSFGYGQPLHATWRRGCPCAARMHNHCGQGVGPGALAPVVLS